MVSEYEDIFVDHECPVGRVRSRIFRARERGRKTHTVVVGWRR